MDMGRPMTHLYEVKGYGTPPLVRKSASKSDVKGFNTPQAKRKPGGGESKSLVPAMSPLSHTMDKGTMATLMGVALEEAAKGYSEGGVPVGAVLADEAGNILARGHNLHQQNNDPTSHGVTQCVRNAGRRRDWNKLTLVTSLSPCAMCAGMMMHLKFKRVVIGNRKHHSGRIDWLKDAGIEIVHMDDPQCEPLMDVMLKERTELWQETIGK